MNIIEAIKSGKRYRRRGSISVDNKTLAFDSNGNLGLAVNGGAPDWYDSDYIDYVFSMRDVLDNDWETEPVYVAITREQFDAAWLEAIQKAGGNLTYGYFECFSKLVAKELGL